MQIRDNAAVTLDYTLHLGDGVIIDKSEPGEPLSYLHGNGQLVPGLEAALLGLEAGAQKRVVVAPADGYGTRDPEQVQTLPRSAFEGLELTVGEEFVALGEDDEPMPVKVVRIEGDDVTIDMNHPLAGETLHFSIEVKGVREATAEELEHGHVHDGEGHHHD
ncbi:MAG: hypothetical protein RL199_350 [Pseudomonadota bacterium]